MRCWKYNAGAANWESTQEQGLPLDYDEGVRLAKLIEEYGAFHEATMKRNRAPGQSAER